MQALCFEMERAGLWCAGDQQIIVASIVVADFMFWIEHRVQPHTQGIVGFDVGANERAWVELARTHHVAAELATGSGKVAGARFGWNACPL